MKNVSVYQNFKQDETIITLDQVINEITSGMYSKKITEVRRLFLNGDIDVADSLKKTLPAITPSGVFVNKRTKDNLSEYSNIIVLDFDKVENLDQVFDEITKIEFTYCCFRSPKGNGIKVFVNCDTDPNNHEQTFNAIADYYSDILKIIVDRSGKDVSRLCFLSADEQLYYKPDCVIFKGTELSLVHTDKINLIGLNPSMEVFQLAIKLANKYNVYYEGNRNNFIYCLATNCNKLGVALDAVLELIPQEYDLPVTELTTVINSAYQNLDQFGILSINSKSYFEKQQPDISLSPILPESVYNLLPNILKSGTEILGNLREKDMFFLSSLSVLSGCLPNYQGEYAGHTVYSNLFAFVIAPPASGKGILVNAKMLGQEYHRKLVNESRNALNVYEQQLNNFKASKSMDMIEDAEMPKEPAQMLFYIPGNSSSAAFIERMVGSKERVVLFETEADTISTILKQEWGSYSEIMRAAFHHESVSINRKGKDGLYEMENPRLSIAISGTPSQVISLVKSVEDGLFSRFIYYIFSDSIHWKDVSPSNKRINRDQFYKNLSKEVLKLVTFFENEKTFFNFTEKQWIGHNDYFTSLTDFYGLIYEKNPYSQSVINRMGLIRFRIAMILSALRQFDTNNHSTEYFCDDLDYDISKSIVDTLLVHSFIIMDSLPQKTENKSNPLLERFHLQLSNDLFSRSQAIDLGIVLRIKSRTVDGYLKSLVTSGKLTKEGNGNYKKN